MNSNHEQNSRDQHSQQNLVVEEKRLAGEYEKILLKATLLINGGAAVALLAFLGDEQLGYKALPLKSALLCFAGGLLLAVSTLFLGYIVSSGRYWLYAKAAARGEDVEEAEFPILMNIKGKGKHLLNFYTSYLLLFVIASFVLFFFGVNEIAQYFGIQ